MTTLASGYEPKSFESRLYQAWEDSGAFAPTGSFERVLEVVPADPSARGPLRERWKHYQSLGFEVNKHDM